MTKNRKTHLRKQFPDIPIVAEEQDKTNNHKAASSDYYFVIDPLDGIQSFVDRIPCFCVSIALCNKSNALAGVVIDPTHKEEFMASAGMGAYLNGDRISVSPQDMIKYSRINVNHNKLSETLFDNINCNILRTVENIYCPKAYA